MGSTSSVWLHDSEMPRDQLHWLMTWRKFERHATVTATPFTLFSRHGKNLYYIADYGTSSNTTSSHKPRAGVSNMGSLCGGIFDAFVYALNHHRHNTDNPGNFEDCMEGLICLMTALTPAYAHALQHLCPVGHSDGILSAERQTLRSKGQFIGAYQIFAQLRTEVVLCMRGWAIFH